MSHDHYYTASPSSASNKQTFSTDVLGVALTFVTDAGVFSKGEIDKGTQLLLERLPKLSGDVLDLGCGWGAIGVTLLKTMSDIRLTMVDVNLRALELAKENLRLNHVQAQVIHSDAFSALDGRLFSSVVTNPPIRAGKEAIYGMFKDAYDHLLPGGALYLVIRKQQGAESAIKFLKGIYQEVSVIKKNAGFQIVMACK